MKNDRRIHIVKKCGGGGEQMSAIVGYSERKTVCVMSSHCHLNIHVFSLHKQEAGKTKEESGENRPPLHQTTRFIKYNTQTVLSID